MDLDRLLTDAERILEDEGVESFMDEGPDLIEEFAKAVKVLRYRLRKAEWRAEMACERPDPACPCSGCSLAAEREEQGEL